MWNQTAQQNRNYAWENFLTGNQVLFMDTYVILSAMPASRRLAVEWFNPASGIVIAGQSIPAGSSSQMFTPPFAGDALLYLVDTAGHAMSGTH
jgi:hypothetical protein